MYHIFELPAMADQVFKWFIPVNRASFFQTYNREQVKLRLKPLQVYLKLSEQIKADLSEVKSILANNYMTSQTHLVSVDISQIQSLIESYPKLEKDKISLDEDYLRTFNEQLASHHQIVLEKTSSLELSAPKASL